jgi:hypothetical protein
MPTIFHATMKRSAAEFKQTGAIDCSYFLPLTGSEA